MRKPIFERNCCGRTGHGDCPYDGPECSAYGVELDITPPEFPMGYARCPECIAEHSSELWTKVPPTEPGWYWAYDRETLGTEVEPVYVTGDDNALICMAGARFFSVCELKWWSRTPLELPQLPESEEK